jgi:hypothetical protein
LSIEKTEIDKIPWITVVILTLALGFVNPLVTVMQQSSVKYWFNIGITTCAEYTMPMSYAFLLFLVILMKIGVFKALKPSTLTYLYACLTTIAFPAYPDPIFVPPTYWADRYLSAQSMEYQPWFFAPEPEIAKQLLAGGVPIPWGAWLPSILWWWLVHALWAIFFLAIASIVRRLWVDIEKLPYPLVSVANEIIKITEDGSDSLKKRTFMSLLIGIITGIIFFAILFMILMFPWFPDIYGWRVNTCGFGATYVTTDSPLSSILALTLINKMPLYVAGMYLVPLSILFNGWFWWIVLAILVQVSYTMGYYTALSTMGGCGRVWCGDEGLIQGLPFIWGTFANLGVAFGILISYIYLTRGYIADTIRAAIRKGTLRDIENEESISYRTAYTMLLISIVALISAFMYASLGLLPALIVIFVTFFYQFLQVYFLNFVGFVMPSGFLNAHAFLKPIWPHAPEPRTMEWTVATDFVVMPAANSPGAGWGFPLLTMTMSHGLAGFTKTSARNVYKVVLFAAVLTPLIALVAFIWGDYTFGSTRLPGYGFTWSRTDRFTPEWAETNPSRNIWWPQALAGFIVAFVLNYMHTRFIWFPFEPIGFLLAVEWGSQLAGLWQPALMAWVLKTITIRVGGSKMYESLGRPIAAGFIIGYAVMAVIGAIIGVVRFFFPF